ncbi:hypothetical protein GW916_00745 [bacterium]|nr:hypothetical protein [bacterium]
MADDFDGSEPSEKDLPRIADIVRRLMVAGLGAAFMTEEAVRSQLGELKLPKDVLNTILQGASKSKEELVNRIGNETMRLISKIDFVKEVAKFAETHKFKINAEIEIQKKE